MNYVVSASPGRLRLRHAGLRDANRLAKAAAKIREIEGSVQIEANVRTGSLLLHFMSDALPTNKTKRDINSCLDALLGSARRYRPARSLAMRVNRIAKYGMLLSLASSLIFAAIGKKRLHVATGVAFVGFAAVHMGVFRRHLLR